MRFHIKALAAGLVAFTLLTAPAAAQNQNAAELDITEDLLVSFVGAAAAVSRVQEDWVRRIGNAETDVEARRLAQQAQAAMKKTIDDAPGITLEEYMGVAKAAKSDPDLALELQARIKTAVGR